MNPLLPSLQIRNDAHFANKASIPVSQFELCTFKWIQQNNAFSTSIPDRAKSFEIIWFKSGSGLLTVDLKNNCVLENSIYIITPGQYRCFICDDEAEGYYISISEEYLHLTESHIDFSLLVEQYKVDYNLPVIQADTGMEDLIVRIQGEYNSQDLLRTEILKSLLKVFLIYLSRRMEQGMAGGNGVVPLVKELDLVGKFMQLLKKHFATKKLVADYADELCITPNYLNFLVKKQTGFPVSHHIQQYIIMEAKRQAFYSGMRMKEVADALGFEDYAHFSKFFKNYSGVNFSSFRKGVLRNNV
ncbi:MAG: AraC family transcriptional regulator [Marivirga sp.]|nr:AraC family transcriptional regulator [Marivirga sp.]